MPRPKIRENEAEILRYVRNIDWALTTEHDCIGIAAPDPGEVRYALYDANEDDPPIAVFEDAHTAESVYNALRLLADTSHLLSVNVSADVSQFVAAINGPEPAAGAS